MTELLTLKNVIFSHGSHFDPSGSFICASYSDTNYQNPEFLMYYSTQYHTTDNEQLLGWTSNKIDLFQYEYLIGTFTKVNYINCFNNGYGGIDIVLSADF